MFLRKREGRLNYDETKRQVGPKKKGRRRGPKKIRVGEGHQAVLPPWVPAVVKIPDLEAPKVWKVKVGAGGLQLVWISCDPSILSEAEVEQYVQTSIMQFKVTEVQALGILFWHGYDVPRATEELGNWEVSVGPKDWIECEKTVFKEAFKFDEFGKTFGAYKPLLPHKSVKELVDYYYHVYKPVVRHEPPPPPPIKISIEEIEFKEVIIPLVPIDEVEVPIGEEDEVPIAAEVPLASIPEDFLKLLF